MTADSLSQAVSSNLTVRLLRDLPEERRFSMERFADEILRHLAALSGVAASSFVPHTSRLAARVGLGRPDILTTRFIRYPIRARSLQGDVFHVVDQAEAHIAALLPKDRVVITCHDLHPLKAAGGIAPYRESRFALAAFRWSVSFLAKAAHVVTPSESTRRDLIDMLGIDERRISVVHNGVSPAFRPLDPEARLAARSVLGGGAFRLLLHVDTGGPYKNAAGSLRILALLRGRGMPARLVRVGRRLGEGDRRLMEGLGLSAHVLDLGYVDDDRLVEVYNAVDVLVAPSYWEGFGFPPLEAMACGTPVVASDCATFVELLGEAALFAGATNEGAFASQVARVLNSPEVSENLRGKGLANSRRFTWPDAARRYAAVYSRVAEAAGPPRAALR